MIQSAFPIQLLVDWYLHAPTQPLPTFLKDLLRSNEVRDHKKLEDFLQNELQQTSLQDFEGATFFFRIYRHALLYGYYRLDGDFFEQIQEIFSHRKQAFRNLTDQTSIHAWDEFSQLAYTAFKRLQRATSIEAFEEQVSSLDWTVFDKNSTFISDLSAIIGFVYRHEDGSDQYQKARIWLQKAMLDLALPEGLMPQMLMADYIIQHGQADTLPFLKQIVDNTEQAAQQAEIPEVKQLLGGIHHLLSGSLTNQEWLYPQTEGEAELDQFLLLIKAFEQQYASDDALPASLKAERAATIANMYSTLYQMTDDSLEQGNFGKQAQGYFDTAIQIATEVQDDWSAMRYRQLRAEASVSTGQPLTEKELKEINQFNKKRNHYPSYVQSIETYLQLLHRNDAANKTFDLILDLFKLGQKKIDQGGFYLIAEGMRLANTVFLKETKLPGVSWMVEELASFFERVEKAIETAEVHADLIGRTLIERFRTIFMAFEPVSHFNILVYYKYQFCEILVMRLGALVNQDELTLKVADQLIRELDNPSNPLHIIKADWDDFKKVPNFVRNHTLNKCISITKGDLPAAAEHLDFSYRNLRSYITFKEVNRLGFFLDLQQTSNRQLEQGIRYMFYDLYKTGTIFEVVFDMPKFLVDYAKSGFYSQDLEEALNIKGTTAKKYIKIMMEIGLIRQDKTTGRKHYYRLVRENVMNRLGKDQNTLIESAQQ